MTQHVQLLKAAVGPKAGEKNKLDSFYKSEALADAWTAFLIVSEPKWALNVLGAFTLASAESVGPRISRKRSMALSPTSSIPVQTSDCMKLTKSEKNGLPLCFS